MGRYEEELSQAGVLRDAEGLHPTFEAVRVKYEGNERVVIGGPFPETHELVSGYWIIEVGSHDEALEWARKVPLQDGEVEVRQLFAPEDDPVELPPSVREYEEQLERSDQERA